MIFVKLQNYELSMSENVFDLIPSSRMIQNVKWMSTGKTARNQKLFRWISVPINYID